MKLQIKNVKIAKHLSEETIAYTATLWIDGVKAASCRNEGQGGPDMIDFADRDLEQRFDEYVQSLPRRPWGFDVPAGSPKDFQPNDETVVQDLLAAWQHEQWIKRKVRTHIVFKLDGDDVDQWRTYGPLKRGADRKPYVDELKNKHGAAIVSMHWGR